MFLVGDDLFELFSFEDHVLDDVVFVHEVALVLLHDLCELDHFLLQVGLGRVVCVGYGALSLERASCVVLLVFLLKYLVLPLHLSYLLLKEGVLLVRLLYQEVVLSSVLLKLPQHDFVLGPQLLQLLLLLLDQLLALNVL